MDAQKQPFDVVDIDPFGGPTKHLKSAAYYPNAPLDRDSDFYNFDYPKRGKAIIFNHREFSDRERYAIRLGTMKDAECLETELKLLQFDVEPYIDLKSEEIQDVILRTAEMDHSQNDCILFVILSHGHMGSFSTHDSFYMLDDLFNAFTADKCPTLAGKPKIFIIQACRNNRNDREDKGIDKGIVFGEKLASASSRALKDFTDREKNIHQMNYSLPSHSDFLVVYATSPGFYSFRSPEGSHFIQALCRELKVNALKLPMYSILTKVNRHIATHFEANSDDELYHGAKQMPCLHSTLTRDLQFNDKTFSKEEQTDSNLALENSIKIDSFALDDEDEKNICSKILDTIFCVR